MDLIKIGKYIHIAFLIHYTREIPYLSRDYANYFMGSAVRTDFL